MSSALSSVRFYCLLFLTMASVGLTSAADWWGAINSNFQTEDNWRNDRHPDAAVPTIGATNKTGLVIQNGGDSPLVYQAADGETDFSGQLLVGQNGGSAGELQITGGTLTVNMDGTWAAIVGQTVEGRLKISGGELILKAGMQSRVPSEADARWGLIIGNEDRGSGVVEVRGGILNVEGGIWLGRHSAAGSLVIGGSGVVTCDGPLLFSAGNEVQRVDLSPGSGVLRLTGEASMIFQEDQDRLAGYVDFIKGSQGSLAFKGRDKAFFDKLVADGRIRVDGAVVDPSAFGFRHDGEFGVYSLNR